MDSLLLAQTNLTTRQMSPKMHDVLSIAVKIVNYIKKNALHSLFFAPLCDRLNSDHLQHLYCCEIRWLSIERVFDNLFKMKYQVYIFLDDQRSPLADHYVDECFCVKPTYLSDIFDQLNQLNLLMQGRNSSLFLIANGIERFKKTIGLWRKGVYNKQYEMPPLFSKKFQIFPSC